MAERMVAPRRRHQAPMKVWFDPDTNTESARDIARSSCILGETVDLSRSGIAFLVPSIRLQEKYLVGQERELNIEMDLPTGKVQMRVSGRRYEKVGIHISTERFFVGAHIVSLSGTDKENYENFLKVGSRRMNSSAASLELRADKY